MVHRNILPHLAAEGALAVRGFGPVHQPPSGNVRLPAARCATTMRRPARRGLEGSSGATGLQRI